MTARYLMAFDFDHTLIDKNSDLHIVKLAPNGQLPQSIKDTYSPDGWNDFMRTVFHYLHGLGVRQSDYEHVLAECQPLDGVVNLLRTLRYDTIGATFDFIVISDANSLFIDYILRKHGLDEYFSAIYTNPAEFDADGLLTLKPYHEQSSCALSTVNLCKGMILDEHVAGQLANGIIYVGDGTNDLCPSLRLDANGWCFARAGYKLEDQALQAASRSQGDDMNIAEWPKSIDTAVMHAKVNIFNDGNEILKVIQDNLLSNLGKQCIK